MKNVDSSLLIDVQERDNIKESLIQEFKKANDRKKKMVKNNELLAK
jgi:hypothetical protein